MKKLDLQVRFATRLNKLYVQHHPTPYTVECGVDDTLFTIKITLEEAME